MDDLSRIQISGFYAINYGDGKALELAWGVTDIYAVKHFVIERYDIYSKKWAPFDGFRGLVTSSDGDGAIPPQRITVFIDASGEYSFRIKSVGKDGSHTDWETTTINVTLSDSPNAPSTYFIQSGLEVTHSYDRTFNISNGVAHIAGNRIPITSFEEITLGDKNSVKYLIYVDIEGSIRYTESDTTPNEAIRIAEVSYNHNGDMTLRDTRFLWAPSNLKVEWDQSNLSILTHRITWNSVEEKNLSGYILYKGTSENNLRSVQVLDREVNEYIDNSGIENGETYYYAIASTDWGNNVSARTSPPVQIKAGDIDPPSRPVNVTGSFIPDHEDGPHIRLVWTPNPDSDLREYRVYEYTTSESSSRLIGTTTTNEWREFNIQFNREYKFAVSAVDHIGNESERSLIESVETLRSHQPQSPDWSQSLTTNGNRNEVWVNLEWSKVTRNTDMSPATDIEGYRIYEVVGETYNLVHDTGQNNVTAHTIRYFNSQRGLEKSYVITAYNAWGSESSYSSIRSIVVGGYNPKAPLLLDPENINETGIDQVIVRWQRVSHDVENNSTDIDRYIVYKGRSPLQMHSVATIQDSGSGDLEWIDGAVERGKQYHYYVIAIDSNENQSNRSDIKIVDVGKFDTPPAPIIVSGETDVSGSTITNTITFKAPDINDYRGAYIYASVDGDAYEELGWIPYYSEVTNYVWKHSNGLQNGLTYQYYLVSVDNSGNQTPMTEAATVSVPTGDITKPNSPSISLSQIWENKVAGIRVSWSSVNNVSGYKVYRSSTGDTYTEVADIPSGNPRVFEDKGLINGVEYFYYVASYNQLGVLSNPSNIESQFAGDTSIPAAPTNLLIAETFDTEDPGLANVILTWNSVSGNIDRYEVWRSFNGINFQLEFTVSESVVIHDVVPYGSHVYYRVRAISDSENQGLFASTDKKIVYTEIPSNVAELEIEPIEQPGNIFRARLDWSNYEPGNFFGRYNIYTSPDNDPSSAYIIGTIPDKNIKTHIIEGLEYGKKYYFGITVVDSYGNESDIVLEEIDAPNTSIPNTPGNLVSTGVDLAIELKWDNPTHNTDGSVLNDFKGIEVYRRKEDDTWELLDTVVGNRYRDNVGANKTETYRIRAIDTANNASEYTDTVTSTSRAVIDEYLDIAIPEPPGSITKIGSGIETSESDNTYNVWMEFEWEPSVSDDVVYVIYVDGTPFGTTKDTSFRANGLFNKGSYEVYITARNIGNGESQPSPTRVITIDEYEANIPPPIPVDVVQYFRAFLIRWEKPEGLRNIAGYEIEYHANSQGQRPTNPNLVSWNPVSQSQSNVTSVIHGRLDYNFNYYYRVRVVDTFDNPSDWAYFENDGMKPGRSGTEDLYPNSVYAMHLFAKQIEGLHINSHTVTGDHMVFRTLTGDHMALKSLKAEHIDISLGSRNYVKNSSFGMKHFDESEASIMGWEVSDLSKVSVVEDHESPIQGHALQIEASSSDEVIVSQELEIPEDTEYLTVSLFVKPESIAHDSENGKGFLVDLYDEDEEERFLSDDEQPQEQYIIVGGSTSWTKVTKVFYVGFGRNSALLRLILNRQGLIRVTGIMVEDGEISTEWSLHESETYGAAGKVQINSDGIQVRDGKLLIETSIGSGSRKVRIDSDGIIAGDSTKYAKMDYTGFHSMGGAFSVTTDVDGNSSLIFDGDGIRLYNSSNEPVIDIGSSGMLTITDGKFSLKSGNATDGVEITPQGMMVKIGNDPKIDINVNSGITIKDMFSIKSNSLGDGGFEVTSDHIKAKDALGNTTFIIRSSDGSVSVGSPFMVSSSGFDSNGNPVESGERIILRTNNWMDDDNNYFPGGIFGYNSSSEMAFRLLSDGTAHFNNSIYITSSEGNSQISITPQGITGQGFNLSHTKLTIENAEITQGDITMDEEGLVVDGAKGIHVKDGNEDVVSITNKGIEVMGEAGVKIEEGGEIVVGNNMTAIDHTGINAEAITANRLHIKSSGASIVVGEDIDSPDVRIYSDNNGGRIDIFDGALNVYGDHDKQVVLIENGKIQARAIDIGIPGSNIIKNGRADFGIDSWIKEGQDVSLSTETTIREETGEPNAGISGDNAFRIASIDPNQGVSQSISKVIEGEVYTLSLRVFVYSGQARVEIDGANDIEDNDLAPTIIGNQSTPLGSYHTIRITFKVDSSPINIKILSNASDTVLYVTDIVLSEGSMMSGYSPHPSEITGNRVSIGDNFFRITSGSSSNILIDNEGITSESFSLTSQGLAMEFDNSRVTINEDGILALANPNNLSEGYVRIDSDGIISNGMFSLTGLSGNMEIDSSGIKMNKSENEYVRIDNEGLSVVGGLIDIRSSNSPNRFEVNPEGLSVIESDREVIKLGYIEDNEDYYGLKIDGGRFELSYDKDFSSVNISNDGITVRHRSVDDEKDYRTEIGPSGLRFFIDNKEYSYPRGIYLSETPYEANKPIPYPEGFSDSSKIFLIPHMFKTYDPGYSESTQHIRFTVSKTEEDFTPLAEYVLDSTPGFSHEVQHPNVEAKIPYNIPMGDYWEAITTSTTTTKIGVKVSWSVTPHLLFRRSMRFSVFAKYPGTGGEYKKIGGKTIRGQAGPFGGDVRGSEWFWTETYPQGGAKIWVTAVNEGGPSSGRRITVSALQYYEDVTIPTDEIDEKNPEVLFVAFE